MAHISSLKLNTVSLNTQYLVYGYVRTVGITNRIIPSSITQLCLLFYHSRITIICVEDDGDATVIPKISIIDSAKNHPFDLYKIRIPQTMRYHMGLTYIRDFTIPKNVKFPGMETLKTVSFIFSTGPSQARQDCCAYVFDENTYSNTGFMDTYVLQLPSFQKGNIIGASVLYSEKHGLITVGNCELSAKMNSFNVLNFDHFNDESNSFQDWQWSESCMANKRQYPSVAFVTEDAFVCIGGTQTHRKTAELYDFSTDEWKRLKDPKFERKCTGLCVDRNFRKDRVYIGGGFWSKSSFEYCDLNKNEWFELPDSNEQHRTWPIMWVDNVNVINVASVEDKAFERLDLRENKWNVYVGNEQQSFDEFFGAKSIDKESRLIINVV